MKKLGFLFLLLVFGISSPGLLYSATASVEKAVAYWNSLSKEASSEALLLYQRAYQSTLLTEKEKRVEQSTWSSFLRMNVPSELRDELTAHIQKLILENSGEVKTLIAKQETNLIIKKEKQLQSDGFQLIEQVIKKWEEHKSNAPNSGYNSVNLEIQSSLEFFKVLVENSTYKEKAVLLWLKLLRNKIPTDADYLGIRACILLDVELTAQHPELLTDLNFFEAYSVLYPTLSKGEIDKINRITQNNFDDARSVLRINEIYKRAKKTPHSSEQLPKLCLDIYKHTQNLGVKKMARELLNKTMTALEVGPFLSGNDAQTVFDNLHEKRKEFVQQSFAAPSAIHIRHFQNFFKQPSSDSVNAWLVEEILRDPNSAMKYFFEDTLKKLSPDDKEKTLYDLYSRLEKKAPSIQEKIFPLIYNLANKESSPSNDIRTKMLRTFREKNKSFFSKAIRHELSTPRYILALELLQGDEFLVALKSLGKFDKKQRAQEALTLSALNRERLYELFTYGDKSTKEDALSYLESKFFLEQIPEEEQARARSLVLGFNECARGLRDL